MRFFIMGLSLLVFSSIAGMVTSDFDEMNQITDSYELLNHLILKKDIIEKSKDTKFLKKIFFAVSNIMGSKDIVTLVGKIPALKIKRIEELQSEFLAGYGGQGYTLLTTLLFLKPEKVTKTIVYVIKNSQSYDGLEFAKLPENRIKPYLVSIGEEPFKQKNWNKDENWKVLYKIVRISPKAFEKTIDAFPLITELSDDSNNTMLHFTVDYKFQNDDALSKIKTLIEFGARRDAKNIFGETPLGIYKKNKGVNQSIISLLTPKDR